MNISSIVGKKIEQTQGFLENGKRVPMSLINVSGNVVCQIKTADTDGYNALQIGFGTRNKAHKAISGHIKKAGLEKTPRFFREIRVDEVPSVELGSLLNVAEILEPGDVVDVTGTSKGKGFAGAVKRHNFKGGPRTHGQSNRERARGSSGQTTTPGRVYKGKRMAGHMGVDTVTVKNLEVLEIKDGVVMVKGLIPGPRGTVVTITRVAKNKKYLPLYKTEAVSAESSDEPQDEKVEVIAEKPVEEAVAQENVSAEVELESTPEALAEAGQEEAAAVKEKEEVKEEKKAKAAEESSKETKDKKVEEKEAK